MISGKILRDAIISGANNINNQRSRVDELNVFPVPDGDTGTNMGMTVGAAVRELQAMDDSCTVGEAAKTAASAMLRGARGNSGVITSLLFRGFSKALEGKKEADAADIVAALQEGRRGRLQGCHEAHRGHHPDRCPRGFRGSCCLRQRGRGRAVGRRARPPVRRLWRTPPTCCPS